MNSAGLYMQSTRVLFPAKCFSTAATVLFAERVEQQFVVITDQTPFHPVSHLWPDHPADKGYLSIVGKEYPVIDVLTAAYSADSGELQLGSAITARRGEMGWCFVVAHIIAAPEACKNGTAAITAGDEITLSVDQAYQDGLSRGHTAGHLASMALNKVLAQGYWRKEADRLDPLGNFDFNSYAQQRSRVTPDACEDHYRLGKTLKKRGLNTAEMVEDLPAIEDKANALLAQWLETPVAISMRCDGELLTDSRYWQIELSGEAPASMPCGGTHATHLAEFSKILIQLNLVDPQLVMMKTRVVAA
uniref:alanyl-tRNA editing protein n=1 Tax=Thaumasiovibrio occultus TaxID=1891184 RepID=UPI00131E4872|nr:alanyl-tRNA editing protein [Thaumasiovibrio occultus]